MTKIAFLFAALLALPALAEPIDITVLETPDRVWIADDLTGASKSGMTIPMFSWVEFRDGRMTDGMVTFTSLMFPLEPCDDQIPCPVTSHSAAILTADYKITEGALMPSNAALQQVYFTRPEDQTLIRAETFLPFAGGVSLQMDEEVLVATKNGQTQRYLPYTWAQIDEVLGIVGLAELSLTTNGPCILETYYRLSKTPEADHSDMVRSFLQLAKFGAYMYDLERQIMRMSQNRTLDMRELEKQSGQTAYTELFISQVATRFLTLPDGTLTGTPQDIYEADIRPLTKDLSVEAAAAVKGRTLGILPAAIAGQDALRALRSAKGDVAAYFCGGR